MKGALFAAAIAVGSLTAQAQVIAGIRIANVRFTRDTQLKDVNLQRCAHDVKTGRFEGPNWYEQATTFVKQVCLQDNGYFTGRVSATTKQLVDSDDTHNFEITFDIVAGPQFRMSDVRFKGNHAIPSSELRALFPLQGDLFRITSIQEGIALMRKAYRARGYPNFLPVPEFDVDNAKNLITLIIDVEEGKHVERDAVRVR